MRLWGAYLAIDFSEFDVVFDHFVPNFGFKTKSNGTGPFFTYWRQLKKVSTNNKL